MKDVKQKVNNVLSAMAIAHLAHFNQVDKVNEPYIRHPLRVGTFFLNQEDYDAAIVGYLHDVIEDTKYCSLSIIEEAFGKEISDAVDAISRREEETYKDYVRRCCKNSLACRIKKQDVIDNMRPDRQWKDAPSSRYRWTLDYIEEYCDE